MRITTGFERLRYLTELGVEVELGCPYGKPHDNSGSLIRVYNDGSIEYSFSARTHAANKKASTGRYEEMFRLLRIELDAHVPDPDKHMKEVLGISHQIRVDIRTIEMPDGTTYQFMVPSKRYIPKNPTL